MAHVVCRTEGCGENGIVKDNRVTMRPGERVMCGPCWQPMAETDEPLTETVTVTPHGRYRQVGYLVEPVASGGTPDG